MLLMLSKKRYMRLRFLYGSTDGRFASVSNTFMRSRINSFPVVVELILDWCNSLYIIGSKPNSA